MNVQGSIEELVRLCALNGTLFGKTFFPNAFRQDPAPFHDAAWKLLDSDHRLVNIQMFRGSAKTTLLRTYTAKRIAYGLANTILYVGKSEPHALRSMSWLRKQVDTNRLFSKTFALTPGSKWQDTESEINHGITKKSVWMMGMGINGSVRGINRDDFRPDLIVLDDVIDDENGATEEQRLKIKERIYGAIQESLAPKSEAPDAKLAMLQTPINRDDASCQALADEGWASLVVSIITPDTADSPIEYQESSWPSRWSSEDVRKEKRLAIARNQSSIWYREKECKLIAPEQVAFRKNWLKFYDPVSLPDYGARVLVIDPVPPPSEKEIEKGLEKKDYEALHVIQRTGNDYYSVELRQNRGHDPSWTIANTFELAEDYNVRMIMVESVNYQRTLAWLIRKAMEQRGRFWQVKEFTDQRNKFAKIVDSLNGVASAGHLFVKSTDSELINQFEDYPRVSHDDALETLAIGVMELSGLGYDVEQFQDVAVIDQGDLDLSSFYGAP